MLKFEMIKGESEWTNSSQGFPFPLPFPNIPGHLVFFFIEAPLCLIYISRNGLKTYYTK